MLMFYAYVCRVHSFAVNCFMSFRDYRVDFFIFESDHSVPRSLMHLVRSSYSAGGSVSFIKYPFMSKKLRGK